MIALNTGAKRLIHDGASEPGVAGIAAEVIHGHINI